MLHASSIDVFPPAPSSTLDVRSLPAALARALRGEDDLDSRKVPREVDHEPVDDRTRSCG